MIRLPNAEPRKRWYLFINPRSFKGLSLLNYHYFGSDKLYVILHAIGSGGLTVSRQPDIDLARKVAQEAIEIQKKLSRAALAGDMAAMFEQSQIPADLESLRVSVEIEHTVRLLLVDLAARLNAVPHAGSQTTSVSALLRAIGTGEMTLLDIVDPSIRLRYLRNTAAVKEYICLQKAKRAADFHQSQQTKV